MFLKRISEISNMKILFILVILHSCSCFKDFDSEKCKDRFGASLNENFAVSKPTGQTSTNGNAHASRSADGNINPYFGNSSCSQTDSGNNLVWEVNLEEDIYLTSVTITSRADKHWSSSDIYLVYGLVVDTSSSTTLKEWKCAEGFFSNTGESILLTCYMPEKCNFVQVRLIKPDGILSLCEVEVHGKKLDYYEDEVNYALHQTAVLSSVHFNQFDFVAILALDGNRNTDLRQRSCMHTNINPLPPYWSVDLGKIIAVNAVTLTSYNLPNHAHRIADFDIRVGFAENNNDEDYKSCVGHILGFGAPETRTIFCTNSIRGRYVTLVSYKQEYFIFFEISVHGEEIECTTPEPFGIETFKIHDSQFRASSWYNSDVDTVHGPQNARLNFRGSSDPFRLPTWTAQSSDNNPWIEIDLLWIVTVTGVLTQGRYNSDQWVTSYSVSSKVDGMDFQFYKEQDDTKIFTANKDRNTIVRNDLRPAVLARWFRIHPVSWFAWCSMRMELIGCQNKLYSNRAPQALGMSNRKILDAQLSASSSEAGFEPKKARLHSEVNGWVAATADESWFQVDFLMVCVILQIQTQGIRTINYWIKEYQISFGSHTQSFDSYKENGAVKTFVGNSDKSSVVSNTLVPSIVAKIIRIHPITWKTKTGLRVEFIGYYRENSINRPLGMESRFIKDSQFDFSAVAGGGHVRYRSPWLKPGDESSDYCWVAGGDDQWMQVDFLRLTKISAIKTQGRSWLGGSEWVVNYELAFGNDGNHFHFYQRNGKPKIFIGNWDRKSINTQRVSPPIVSRFIRIYAREKNERIGLRVEFEGTYLGFPDFCQTARPLGMEDRRISTYQLTASTYFATTVPDYGRLNEQKTDEHFGVWLAKEENTDQWYQADFEKTVKLVEIQTQGRPQYLPHWVKEYSLSYGLHPDRIDSQFYQENGQTKVFQANFDRDTIVRNALLPTILARIVRLHIVSWNVRIAMRMEFIGTYEVPHGPALIDPSYVPLEKRLTASSFLDLRHQAIHGIISDQVNATSWTPATDKHGEYIQVDLLQLTAISGVGLRTGGDQPNDSYVEVMMRYSDKEGSWKTMRDYNGDIMTLSTSDCDIELDKIVLARFVRLVITGWGSRTGFLFQLYGSTEPHNAGAGIEDGSIKDTQMKSSNHPNDPYPAREARLNQNGAWCGNLLRKHLFLQIDFLSNFEVHAISTQSKSVGITESVTHYKLSSTLDGINWNVYEEQGTVKVFVSNTSCQRCIRKHIVQPFLIRSLRFLPTSWKNRPCMRVEAYGVYKGILQVHVLSGAILDSYGNELKRNCSIKLNGLETCKSNNGINVVVISYKTGHVVSSNTTEEYSLLNSLLKNIDNHSILVISTQKAERPPEETLKILQSLGGINLRYSLTSGHDKWILVGYKGPYQVNWIAEKVGKKDEAAIRVATNVHLNQLQTTPEFHKYSTHTDNRSNITELSVAGHHDVVVHNLTTRCENAGCQPGLSLAMWMKHDIPSVNTYTTRSTEVTQERFIFEYYSNGYTYFFLSQDLNWIDSRQYCLTRGADLPVILDEHTELAINKMIEREGASNTINIGLKQNPVSSEYEWVDGSPFEYEHWSGNKPNGGECTSRFGNTKWDSLNCAAHLRKVLCQQSIEDLLGIVPMGVENNVIPDNQMTSSTRYDGNHDSYYGRVNTKRNGPEAWCALNSDDDPYLQVNLGHIRTICAVGTQGYGNQVANYRSWPKSYYIKLGNDSSTLFTFEQRGRKKIFVGNYDPNSMVINRFHEPAIAQIIQFDFFTWNAGYTCCARVEIFACSDKGKEDKVKEKPSVQNVPKSITVTEPEHCLDVLMSGNTDDGVYMINPGNGAFPVYCDQTTDGGGWTVLQKRMDGTVDFYRNYEEYEAGFGDVSGEYWLGLSKMATLTHSYSSNLRVDLKDWDDATFNAVYSDFTIDEDRWGYKLGYKDWLGPGVDGLYDHRGSVFHAKDKGSLSATAVSHGGGWWYDDIHRAVNLNGLYYHSKVGHINGIKWINWRAEVLKETKMMIRWNGKDSQQGALEFTDWHSYQSTAPYQIVNVDVKLSGSSFLNMVDKDVSYVQGDFFTMRRITHISTQAGTNSHYVKDYYLKLSPGNYDWIDYKEHGVLKIFEGNNDASNVVSNCLKEPDLARMVRLIPNSCEGTCSLRVEVYSCFEACSKPIDIQNTFPGYRLAASPGYYSLGNPWRGRLHFSGSQWTTDSVRVNEFLEIRLLELLQVTSVATQGGERNGVGCWVKTFSISYLDKNMKWKKYRGKNGEIFPGNVNSFAVLRTHFDTPFLANMVRIVVKTWHSKICMRTEVYGCPAENPIFVLHTQSATSGLNVVLNGRYRYCGHSECPGCLKSLWLRAFGQDLLVAKNFSYDCQYHNFQVNVIASTVPGRHKVYMGASEHGNFADENLVDEKLLGVVTVTQAYANCIDVLLSGQTKSGVYRIQSDGGTAFEVYCDQETFGGGWTVFQRRVTDEEDFNRVWADYKAGFGNLDTNFWLGNDYIHRLTLNAQEMLLDLHSIANDDQAFILYKSFQVENEDALYKLHVSEYQESVGDCLYTFNGKMFSTSDQDHDNHNTKHCAQEQGAGWWFNLCAACFLNGLMDVNVNNVKRIYMDRWQNNRFLDRTEMKLRSKQVVTCDDQYCLYLVKTSLIWKAALAQCRSFNADLLSVRDASENQWIVENVLKSHNVSRVHLGIYNGTQWTDGSTFVYNNFLSSASLHGCPYLRIDGVWDVGDCESLRHTVCKRAKFCYKDACHVYFPENKIYSEAESSCRDIGYNLIKINSKEKNEYVTNVVKSTTIGIDYIDVFIGLRRSGTEFLWFDGTRIVLDNWLNEIPPSGSDCFKLKANGFWAGADCLNARPVVCEKVYNSEKKPIDCLELLMSGSVKNGRYEIYPDGKNSIDVYCDQETFGGGWTLLMRRAFEDIQTFNQKWDKYKNGFGAVDATFWLGNDLIHKLTNIAKEVLFDLNSAAGDKAYVHYKTFKIADESNLYRLTIGDYQTSAAGDGMSEHNNQPFSSKDRDNDLSSSDCANMLKGGWWYKACATVSLTGKYDESSASSNKIKWETWTNNDVLSRVEMKIRSKSVVNCNDHFCYYQTYKRSSWPEAVQECRQFNADLVSINSEADQIWIINNILIPSSIDEIYIGLGMESNQRWTDDSLLSFNKIGSIIPSDKCVVLKQDGSWDVVDCTEPKHILCKRGKFCFNGDCYVLKNTPFGTVPDNEAYCPNLGHSLAKISSELENNYVVNLMKQFSDDSTFTQSFYIGLRYVNGRYQWPDSTILQYSKWFPSQPNAGAAEPFCIYYEGLWYDATPNYDAYFICEKGPIVNSCEEVRRYKGRESGFYLLNADGGKRITVYCDLSSKDGPWTVIQRRLQGSLPTDYHSKSWDDYKDGFKSDEMNFWLGNKYIHKLTKTPQRLKIIITTEEFHVYEAVYEDFTIKDESSGFEILFGSYSGTAGDSLSKHRGMRFSTIDQDTTSSSCTTSHPGGWWFADCLDSNLNGVFNEETNDDTTVFWKTLHEKIMKVEMKIQPYDVSNMQFSGIIQTANASLGMSFTTDSTEIVVRTSSEEWKTHVPSPGPFLAHVAVTWEENGNLKYYENGSLRSEDSSVTFSQDDNQETAKLGYREAVWLSELTLWNSALAESSANKQYKSRKFTFEDDTFLWTFENSSLPYSWKTRSNCTRSELTGPCGDHTHLSSLGTFVFTEASRPSEHNDRAVMISPNLPGFYRCLKFWVHMLGEKFGSLNIHFSTDMNITRSLDIPELSIVKNYGNNWRRVQVDVDVTNVFKIAIEAKRGDGPLADIAVDDVTLTAESCEKECNPPCKIGEKCDLVSLVCVYEGYYDHRWTLDASNITDEKDSKLAEISGDVQIQSDGVIKNCTVLRGDGKIEFRTFKRNCDHSWCFPFYTLSFWLKYEKMDSQNILSFGGLVKIIQGGGMAEEEQISVEVNSAYLTCSTEVFVPSTVWSHIIVSVRTWQGVRSVYLDGKLMANSSRFLCTSHDEVQDYDKPSLVAGGDGNVNFALDDVRLVFDGLEMPKIVESYKNITGFGQIIFIQAEVLSESWNDNLLDKESDDYKRLSEMIKMKVWETFTNRSKIKDDVVVEKFTQGSVIADINIIYDEISYQDILLVEEVVYLDNSFNGLNFQSYEVNSTSVPNVSPTILSCISPNSTTIYLNWTEVSSLDLNGIFQGYKILYRVTESSTHMEYTAEVSYGNETEIFLYNMELYTNYTLRILAFTLSGDGFISDSITVITLDGEPEAPNITVTNISSTSLYVNWTMLPNTTSFYKQLQGYVILYWEESNQDDIYNKTQFENNMMVKNLKKWTVYCFNVTGVTFGNLGQTSVTQCARTFEDAPEEPPRNITVVNVGITEIELNWLPPNKLAIPGILRYYNLTYRVLNDSSSMISSQSVESNILTYTIPELPAFSLVQINISAYTVSSGPIQSLLVLTKEGVPEIAPNLTAVNVSSTSFKVNWTYIPKIFHNGIFLGYHLYLWEQITGEESAQNFTYSPSVVVEEFHNVSKWTVYCMKIAGFTSVGDGPLSTVQCTRTYEDAPEAPPSDLKATDIAMYTIDVEWSPPPSDFVPGIIREYNLTYRNLNYTHEMLTKEHFESSVTSYRMENLIGLTLYEINVTSTTILPGPWATLYVLTLEGVPAISPQNATWMNTSSTSLKVEWSFIPKHLKNGILRGYRLFIWKESEGPTSQWNVTTSPTNNTIEIKELQKYTRYCGEIEAFTNVGPGIRSPVQCMRTFEDAAEIAPDAINVSNITWNECYLSWKPVNLSFVPGKLRAYRVTYRITDPRFDQSNTTFLVDSQFNSTVVTGLLGFVDYEIMVNGYTVKDGPISILNFKTEEGVPTSPPSGFLSTDVTVTTITMAWQEIPLPERHGIITGYQMTYRKTDSRSKRDVEKTLTFDGNTHTAFLYKLSPYTNYTITLTGRTSVGYGVQGEVIITTLQGVPSVSPKQFAGVNFTSPTKIYLSWGALSKEELQGELSGYEVSYQEFSIADEEIWDPPPAKVITVNEGSVVITGLETFTTYKVTVSAISGGGKGVISPVLYIATCRCHKTFNSNYWNLQPYVNISGHNKDRGFFPYLLDMVTLYCCQNCLEHGTTNIDYFHDGEGKHSEKESDIDVKRNLSLKTDYSFPVYGFYGQVIYAKYYGYAAIVDVVGTVFFALKPDSSVQGAALFTSVLSIMPFLAFTVVFAHIAGVIIWVLERKSNQDEFPASFTRGGPSGFWWAYITMTTVGYGDKTARTLPGRVFAVIWVLIGLVISSLLIGSIATAFTSTTSPPEDSVKMLYGAKIGALHDSPDHKLGVRRNAEVNKIKKYQSLKELRKAVVNKEVDGLLVDSYVADSGRNLFHDLTVKQVIDMRSSYGVVMGKDASKIRKCINMFWKENAATKTKFIKDNTNPVVPLEVSTAEMVEEALSNENDMYTLTLYICLILLCIGTLCGCMYELRRRKKCATKVSPEVISVVKNNLNQEISKFMENLQNILKEIKQNHKKQIVSLYKRKQRNSPSIEEGENVSTEIASTPS